jgi:hypothetical protein
VSHQEHSTNCRWLPTSRRNLLHPPPVLKMEAVCRAETLPSSGLRIEALCFCKRLYLPARWRSTTSWQWEPQISQSCFVLSHVLNAHKNVMYLLSRVIFFIKMRTAWVWTYPNIITLTQVSSINACLLYRMWGVIRACAFHVLVHCLLTANNHCSSVTTMGYNLEVPCSNTGQGQDTARINTDFLLLANA